MTNWRIIAGLVCGISLTYFAVRVSLWWKRRRALRKGLHGEKMVARLLGSLPHGDFRVLNDLLLPASGDATSQIDHVVVSTRGIFVIETKSLAGRISGTEQGQYWQQHLSSQSRSFYNPTLQNRSHVRSVRRLLRGLDGDVFTSMVVFTEAWRLDIKANDIVIERSLLPDKHILRTLIPAERRKKHWWSSGAEVVLDEHKIVTMLDGLRDEILRRPEIIDRDKVNEIAHKLLDANLTDRTARREHVNYAKRTSATISAEIAAGRCPRCGSPLVTRKGAQGEFVGCSRYPECRFTCSIDHLKH